MFLKGGKKRSTSLQNILFEHVCFVVTTRSLRYYAVTMVTTRSLRGHYGHYAIRKSTCSRKRSTSLQNGQFGHCCRTDFIIFKMDSLYRKFGFNFDSIMLKKVSIMLHFRNNEIGVKPSDSRNETGSKEETGQPE